MNMNMSEVCVACDSNRISHYSPLLSAIFSSTETRTQPKIPYFTNISMTEVVVCRSTIKINIKSYISQLKHSSFCAKTAIQFGLSHALSNDIYI